MPMPNCAEFADYSLSEPQLNSYIVYKSFSYILFCCITEINKLKIEIKCTICLTLKSEAEPECERF